MPADGRTLPHSRHDTTEKRFLAINRDRLRRVYSNLTPRQRDFLDLLPLLFHINHPLLPGYVARNTPCGIRDYVPRDTAVRAARRMCRSFEYDRRSAPRYAIRGLYMMGSPGTIAYSRDSDLDMWLCHDPGLEPAAIAQLAEKARKIEEFAAGVGLETHFFVLDTERFRRGETLSLSPESSGSSQHSLLLDEFYRSSLLVAGLRPLWWRVPTVHETAYDDYTAAAVARRDIDPRDYIDFGGLPGVPVEEFFGAAVWQLYKSIQSPYKSVLKLLLMEAYAGEYPRITLLSHRYKHKIESNEIDLDSLDPYIFMYTKIEEHLMACNDSARLDLLRRCFYIKANLRLSARVEGAGDDWRGEVLAQLVRAWGWTPAQVLRLDQREDWRIDTAVEERRDLISTLKASYSILSRFAREHATDRKISERDLHVLGRQLYAAFEKKPSKVEVITRGICTRPTEPHLSLHETRLGGATAWLLFAGVVRPSEAAPYRPLKRCASAAEILAWCHLNRLSDAATQWHVFTQDNALNALEIRRINEALERDIAADDRVAAEHALQARPRIAQVLLLVNVGIAPFASNGFGAAVLTSNRTDVFQFGARRINLVRTLDLVFVTTWAETFSFRYEGGGALLEALAECLQWVDPEGGRAALPRVAACCFTSDLAGQVAARVAATFTRALGFLTRHAVGAAPHFIMETEEQLHHIRLARGKPELMRHGGQAGLLRTLGDGGSEDFNTVRFDSGCTRTGVLPYLYAHNREGRLQIFARQHGQRADVYVLDERGLLLAQRQECYAMATLLEHYRRFLDTALPRCAAALAALEIETMEILAAGGEVQFKRYPAASAAGNHYLSLQVLADADAHGHQQFTIYANDREFSTWEHGGSLFLQVAEFVLSQRRAGGNYPIYITDLDLSTRFRRQNGIATLRPIDLLNYKKRIEYRLTRALTRELPDPGGAVLAS